MNISGTNISFRRQFENMHGNKGLWAWQHVFSAKTGRVTTLQALQNSLAFLSMLCQPLTTKYFCLCYQLTIDVTEKMFQMIQKAENCLKGIIQGLQQPIKH